MKEKTPYCPACQTDHYVVLDKRSTQLSTALGGLAGACAVYAKSSNKSPAAFILAILTGFLTGAATGGSLGEHIDSKMRIQFRCNQCGGKFKG